MLKVKNIIMSLIASLIIIGFGATQVMAAEIGTATPEVNVGDTVEVTVKLDEATRAVDLVLNYDSDNFEYVSVDSGISPAATAVNAKEAGVVRISAASVNTQTNEVKYTFTAKAVTDESTEPFTASGIVTESSEALTVDTVSVKVVEPVVDPDPETPVDPEQPTDPEQPDLNEPADDNNQEEPTTNNNDNNNSGIVDEDGNEITKLPQTGVSIISVLAIVAVAGIAVFGIRKLIK